MGPLHGRWSPESIVDGDLIPVREAVGFVRHTDDRHQFSEHGGAHPGLLRRRMRGNAVGTAVRHTDGDIHERFGQGIEGAGHHDRFEAVPGPLEMRRVMRERLPEVVDPVRVACCHDVVIDGAYRGRGGVVVDKAEGGHLSSIGCSETATCPSALRGPESVRGPQQHWHVLYGRKPVAVHHRGATTRELTTAAWAPWNAVRPCHGRAPSSPRPPRARVYRSTGFSLALGDGNGR